MTKPNLEILVLKGEVVQSVGEGVHNGYELGSDLVCQRVEEKGRLEELLLPDARVQQFDRGRNHISLQAQLLARSELNTADQGSRLQATQFRG